MGRRATDTTTRSACEGVLFVTRAVSGRSRAEGRSLNETVKQALKEAVERRRNDPEFKARLRRIIEEDRELLERLAK